MRKPNSTAEFESARREFLLTQFRQVIAGQSKISAAKAFHAAASAPAPRFWVSEPRAAAVVGKMLADESCIDSMTEEKREMYREIYRRFIKIRRMCPDMTIADIVFDIVNAEAPKSYLSKDRARSIIYKAKKALGFRRNDNMTF